MKKSHLLPLISISSRSQQIYTCSWERGLQVEALMCEGWDKDRRWKKQMTSKEPGQGSGVHAAKV